MNENILIVEADPLMADHLSLLLQQQGYRVAGIAVSVESALAQAAEAKPDLIIMDILLEGDVEGIEAAQRINATPPIPILFMTAHDNEAFFQRAKITRTYAYLLKPPLERELALYRHQAEQQQAQDTLLRYRTALDSSADAIYLIDRESLQFIDMNETACNTLGYTREEMLGKRHELSGEEMERTILLVDDEHHVTEAIIRVLRQDGYRILIANLPARALEILADEAVQVVLTDQQMPGMSGVELLTQVCERHPDTVRMVLTGHADLDSVIDAVNRGAVYKYLTKPWDNEALRATVHEAFHHYELQQQKAGLLREIELANQQLTELNLELARGLEAKAEQLARLANYDAVTGLPNRVLFSDRLHQALVHGERNASLVGLMLLDLDRFKYVNDSLGHPVGDELLRIIGERLQQALRSGDTVARGGGDEFMFVLNDLRDPSDAADIAHKLLECLSGAYQLAGSEIFMTGSIGISIYPNDGLDAVSLTKNADAALFHAKREGRNNYQYYTGSMNANALKRLALESSLRRAVEREEFALLYQPQLDLITGRIIGVEALLRWNHPGRGLVSPADFIPLLEETGLIVPVGEWVLRTACRQSRAWLDAGMTSIRMAVNMSALQFQQPDLVGMVAGILTESAIDPACQDLELELTESLIMRDVEKTIITLNRLHEMGVKLSIDDFGTGYSSLSYLKRFPISTLKIDQSFVRDLERNPDDAAIVAAVISLGHSLKMSVIAEGVETEAQLDYLRQAGCDEMQGYLFSRPVSASEIELMIRTDRRCTVLEV